MAGKLVKIGSASGQLEAEILRSMLEAHGIRVWLSNEAVGSVYGLGVGPTAQIDLIVHSEEAEAAREILDDYYQGRLESED